MPTPELGSRWRLIGAHTGLTAVAAYTLLVAIPLPDTLTPVVASPFGPLIACASIGLSRVGKSFAGVTKNDDHAGRGSNRLSAASSTRSAGRTHGGPDLPLQHLQLLAQHEDLELLRALRAHAKYDQLEQAAQRPIDERHHNANPVPVDDGDPTPLSTGARSEHPSHPAASAPAGD